MAIHLVLRESQYAPSVCVYGGERPFSKVGRSISSPCSAAQVTLATNIVSTASLKCLSKAIVKIKINEVTINVLIDKFRQCGHCKSKPLGNYALL